jgi:hypothetical protein
VFKEVMEMMPGVNENQRRQQLWLKMKHYYDSNAVPNKSTKIKQDMIQKAGHAPHLECKAAQCRYHVPFAQQLAYEHAEGSAHKRTVNHLMNALLEISLCIKQIPFPKEAAADLCVKFCQFWTVLEKEALLKGDTLSWRIKPKMHLFQELMEYQCQNGASPNDFWTYKDEDWGGFVAKMGGRRGGNSNPCTIAKQVLTRFRCMVTEKAVLSWAPGRNKHACNSCATLGPEQGPLIMSKKTSS